MKTTSSVPFVFVAWISWFFVAPAGSAALPATGGVDLQPLAAQVARLQDALDYLGAPLGAADRQALTKALALPDATRAVEQVQRVLDAHCIFKVTIRPNLYLWVDRGPRRVDLHEHGWSVFLVKVTNEAGVTGPLQVESPSARRLYNSPAGDVPNRWLEIAMFDDRPLLPALSGLRVEYRIIQLYSRDAGRREATVLFNVAHGKQYLGGVHNETAMFANARPARAVTLRVRDEDGQPTIASFLIKDRQGRVYPSPAKRLAPDMPFHHQVYRGDGDVIKLPDGEYTVELSRGPESVPVKSRLAVNAQATTAEFRTQRWVDPSKKGWWSGDHHIHASGCAHYTDPTQGVRPADMVRQIVGEDLKVGSTLTWGPGFDYQKQFFLGAVDKVSQYPYLLRYDIEVSGFGSHRSGHLCLLRLRDQMYPGGNSTSHWPTLGLNTLRWAKRQGAITGPAHSGLGLQVNTAELPNYVIPPFSAIGANEYIVDVTHEVPGPDGRLVPAVDFISTVDTAYPYELNIWYHTLNAGFRTRISGETDYPCMYDERVGMGRSYVKLDGRLDYDQWCDGIRLGRNYVSDGKSHLMEFKANEVAMGTGSSELRLAQPGKVRLTVRVAARLDEQRDPAVPLAYDQKPYWDIEKARVGATREVPIEVVVNGYPVAKRNIVADGREQDVAFEIAIARSSWVALRILPSSHTNPIFVLVGGKAIRASKRSVEWCLKGVDQCWSQKEGFIAAAEMEDAKKAYAHARETYKRLLTECEVE